MDNKRADLLTDVGPLIGMVYVVVIYAAAALLAYGLQGIL